MHPVDWLIIASFALFWPLGAYLFWRFDIGGYRSEREDRKKNT